MLFYFFHFLHVSSIANMDQSNLSFMPFFNLDWDALSLFKYGIWMAMSRDI